MSLIKKQSGLFFLVMWSALTPAAGANNLDQDMTQTLVRYAHRENASEVIAAVAMVHQKTKLFANIQKKSMQTYFPIASITKTFTAALILELIRNQHLRLEDRLEIYLPAYSQWKAITVGMLLNQTSGLADYSKASNFFIKMARHPNHLYSSQELLKLAYNMKPLSRPGEKWSYSNTNYLLLGLIAEKITGRSLEELYNDYLFKPNQLYNTFYFSHYFPLSLQKKMVAGFFGKYVATPTNMSWGQAAAGIISTPNNLIDWARSIYDSQNSYYFAAIKANRINLKNGRLTHDHRTPTFGLGVFTVNTPYGLLWYTPGLASGYRNVLAYFPCQGVYIAASTNNGDTPMSSNADLISVLMQTLLNNPQSSAQIEYFKKNNVLPDYCKFPSSEEIKFPSL